MTKPYFYLKVALALDFVLTCNIKLGTAPTDTECERMNKLDYANPPMLRPPGIAGRKRRQTDQTEFTQTTGAYDF